MVLKEDFKIHKKKKLSINFSFGRIHDVDIALFTKHLAVILDSGITLSEGLEILAEQSKGTLHRVLKKIHESVMAGVSFHDSLAKYPKHFSPIFLNMVKAGEVSGNLSENLERLSIQLKKSIVLKKKIKSAMIYPTLIFVAIFGLGMSVAIFVLPKLVPLFETLDVELPISTQILIWTAKLFENHSAAIFAGLIAFVVGFLWLVRINMVKPITHRIYLKIPVFGVLIKNIALERFCHTFGVLLKSGLTVDRSLRITYEATNNRVFKKSIKKIIKGVTEGNPIKYSIDKYPHLYPLLVTKMVGVGETTGNLDETLLYLSDYYEEVIDDATKDLSTIIEPVLLIIIGIVVGFVAIAILGPIYEITGSLR